MGMLANAVRIAVVIGAVIAAAGSTTSNPPPPPRYGRVQPPPQQQPQQYTPCQYACGQMMRCQIQAYDPCMLECAQSGTEQQPGGAQQLYAMARMSCPQLAQTRQHEQPVQRP